MAGLLCVTDILAVLLSATGLWLMPPMAEPQVTHLVCVTLPHWGGKEGNTIIGGGGSVDGGGDSDGGGRRRGKEEEGQKKLEKNSNSKLCTSPTKYGCPLGHSAEENRVQSLMLRDRLVLVHHVVFCHSYSMHVSAMRCHSL